MKRAAIGIRVHSGWGALVAIAGDQRKEELLIREKITVINSQTRAEAQPYHYAEEMTPAAAKKHLAACMKNSSNMALKALKQICAQLQDRGFSMAGAVILLSSARPLPELDKILNSHPLIHTAEGEFFRQTFREALKKLQVPVFGIRESLLHEQAQKVFGKAANDISKKIDVMGKLLGPPWTKDQKTAALAAAITLAQLKHPDRFLSAQ